MQLPNLGSSPGHYAGTVEVEIDSTLINEPERFHEPIRQVFRLAQQAIDEELGRQQARRSNTTNGSNGHAAPPAHNGGNGQHANANGRAAANASGKQLEYARQLAKSIQGLGIGRLENLAEKMFGKQLVALTTLDASGLIDTLKSIKAGEIDISAVLGTAA